MDEARIRDALTEALPESGLPGVAVAATRGDGQDVSLAIGRLSPADPAPVAEDTLFWIASMTKAVTSTAALQLVGEGRLGLDDPVGAWAPELAAPRVLEGFDAEGRPKLRPAKRPVTLRTLLTHTSGLAYDFVSADMNRWVAFSGAQLIGPATPKDIPLMFDPGEGWIYGLSLDFVGRLIEAITGQDLGAALAERIFRPLGMTSTTFARTADQRARTAPMHARLPDGGLAPIPFGLPDPPHFMMGGGGLYSTATDYLSFLRALMGEESPLLPRPLLELLTTPQVTQPRPGAFASVRPDMSNDFDVFPGQPTGWTLGFLTNLEPGANGRSAGSLAWAGISNCYYWLDRQAGVAGVMLAQMLPFADPRALALFGKFERAVYGG
jgi:CubicO group peptidase (beta-lactamase class C family)